MKTLIFSDVHLNVAEDGRPVREAFITFLRTINPAEVDRIVILGDLFDFWFEYKHVIFSGYFDVLRPLADLHDAGVRFHFVCGNHDFWAGRFLRDHLDFDIHFEPLTLDFGGERVQFVHGDGINPKDVSYRIYKKIARFRPVVWAFGCLHPDWAMGIAQRVSRGSRHMFGAHDLSQGSEVKPIQEYAIRTLAAGDADVVMCGHTHYPVLEEHQTDAGATGLYINPGDWLHHQTFVDWEAGRFRLLAWNAGRPEVITEGATGRAE
jgi:UDP-2,3-diacylglucosamine hydrolase